MKMIAVALAVLLCAAPAVADEMWNSEFGDVIYERDVGNIAVFSFPYRQGRAEMYVENLIGNFERRGIHDGYWIAPGTDGLCSGSLTGPDGNRSNNWGRFTLRFENATAPSGFIANLGECFKDPDPIFQVRAFAY